MPALLVDLDDTLLDDRGAMASAVLTFRRKHGLALCEDDEVVTTRWDESGRRLWRRLAFGEVGFQEQRRLRLREVFSLHLADDQADALFADYLNYYERSWRLLPGAEEFLEATCRLPRVILTNGHRPQAQRKLEQLGLSSQFEALVTPDDCGARKPDPKIFLHTLDLLGVKASQAVMIGDDMDADIKPALALGMKVFHVSPFETGRSIRDAASAAHHMSTDAQ